MYPARCTTLFPRLKGGEGVGADEEQNNTRPRTLSVSNQKINRAAHSELRTLSSRCSLRDESTKNHFILVSMTRIDEGITAV